jgi:poly-beta-1,6-N-acetyl-D-glucosamine synthase
LDLNAAWVFGPRPYARKGLDYALSVAGRRPTAPATPYLPGRTGACGMRIADPCALAEAAPGRLVPGPDEPLPASAQRDLARGDLALALALLPPAGRVVALVPAHNEEGSIDLALDSLARQTRRPDLVIVAADNCTDGTISLVRARRDAIAVPTEGNTHKKAGALNQVLDVLLSELEDQDAILVMDADSWLDEGFVEAALARLGTSARTGKRERRIAGVGGTFRGGRGGGLVGMFQRNEYARYARDVRRLKGKVLVLTGTASLFQVRVLREVSEARRAGTVPGATVTDSGARIGQVYDTSVLTEDNELTLALLHLGYAIVSPKQCVLETEVMTTWRELWNQRLRWKRGALENLIEYGLTRITWRYWGRQLLTHLGVLVTGIYLASILLSLMINGTMQLHPIWLAVTAVFMAERVVTVRARGPLQMAIAATLVVEMAFDVFLQATQAKALWDTLMHSERNW